MKYEITWLAPMKRVIEADNIQVVADYAARQAGVTDLKVLSIHKLPDGAPTTPASPPPATRAVA